MELLLGCGHRRDKRVVAPGTTTDWQQLVTLDHNQACQPDLLCDLQQVPWAAIPGGSDVHSPLLPMILSSDTYDEVHAYEVLEHVGRQGDARAFFDTFSELWRILKPGGMVCATVPSRYSPWLWGDPGHTRAILRESLVFLDYKIGRAHV